MKLLLEIAAYVAFAAVVGLLSVWPRYELVGDDEAIVSVAFSHAAERIGECRRLTQEELNELPPNMRRPDQCPRERHALRLQLLSDGEMLYSGLLPPSGLWDDGKASVYKRIRINAGRHEIAVAMNDNGDSGPDHTATKIVDVEPGQNVVVRFVDGRFEIQ